MESYLNAFQLASEKDPARLQALVEKNKVLRSDYETRHAYWIGDLREGALKTALVEKSYRPALEFLDIKDKEFIPAVLRGDKAAKIREGTLILVTLQRFRRCGRRGRVSCAAERRCGQGHVFADRNVPKKCGQRRCGFPRRGRQPHPREFFTRAVDFAP